MFDVRGRARSRASSRSRLRRRRAEDWRARLDSARAGTAWTQSPIRGDRRRARVRVSIDHSEVLLG